MSEDDDHIFPVGHGGADSGDAGLVTRRVAPAASALARGVGAGLRRVRGSRLGGAVEGLVRGGADAAADALSSWLRDPEHVRGLQSTLARVAQFGMERGFEKDPDARLLFDFADWIEAEHGRLAVIAALLDDSPLLDGSLLGLMEAALQPWQADSDAVLRRLRHAQTSLLRLLVRMASLQTGEPMPPASAGADALAAAFRDPLIPERFHPLADKALGLPDAFEQAPETGPKPGAAAPPSSGLQRFVPTLHDPATRFVVLSYVFFMQTYLTRAMLESFPDILAALDALESSGSPDDEAQAGIIDR